MPVTTIDPTPALIVIDLQKGITSFPTVHPASEIIASAATLARAFREAGLPVALVNVSGGAPGRNETPFPATPRPADWAELVPELDAQPSDLLVTKRTWGAFRDTGLETSLKERGVTQVVVCGIATSMGVESTARQAHEAGFHVVLATDAMTDRSPEAHANSLTRIFPRLGETGSVQEILALLAASRTEA
jgi:nicotinamidase-related amidase